ncbi:MAG: hypothetical protein MJ250_01140 [Alphaproteobacteria bacterium]|nr:hypothetical protein [Alphaproteobacteria bacterium]
MILPGYIRDILQINYFVSLDELNKPFEQMSPNVQSLITEKCMVDGHFIPEDQSAQIFFNQLKYDLDCEDKITTSQKNRFVQNQETLSKFLKENEKEENNDFDLVASLIATKRVCSDEYANQELTYPLFTKVQKEVREELEVKYWTARTFQSKGIKNASSPEEIAENISTISQMVQTNQSDKISQRFNLKTDRESVEDVKAAICSVCMGEFENFKESLNANINALPIVKKAKEVDTYLKEKHPKKYAIIKGFSSLASALTFGPAYSAFKATTTINAMKKDYKNIKDKDGTNASFWKYLRSKEGRQKLLTTGQNVLRIIPGVRAVGMALGAIKNSDGLVSSIKEIKESGGSKKAWLKVAACTAGLLAVSTAAAFANDDIADSVNSFVNEHIGGMVDKISDVIHPEDSISMSSNSVLDLNLSNHNADFQDDNFHINIEDGVSKTLHINPNGIEARTLRMKIDENTTLDEYASISSGNAQTSTVLFHDGDETIVNTHSGSNVSTDYIGTTHTHDNGFERVEVKNGHVNAEMNFHQMADQSKDGFTVTKATLDTEHHGAGIEITDNQSGIKVMADTKDGNNHFGIEDGVSKTLHINQNGIEARALRMKIDENTTLDEYASISSGNAQTSTVLFHDGDETIVNTHSGSNVSTDYIGTTHTHDNGFERVEVKNGHVNTQFNLHQKVDGSKDGLTITRAAMDTEHHSTNFEITDNKTGEKVNLNNQVSNSFENTQTSTEIRHDGHQTLINTHTGSNASSKTVDVTHSSKDGSYERLSVKDGKATGEFAINQAADPTEPGYTVTHASASTRGNGKFVVTNNETGRRLKIAASKDGEVSLTSDSATERATKVTLNRNGDITIGKEGGRTVNLTKFIKAAKNFIR